MTTGDSHIDSPSQHRLSDQVSANTQKVLLAVKNMGGETSEAWRAVLDDLVKRGCASHSS